MSVPTVRSWLVDAAQRIDAALGPARVKRIVLPPLADRPGKEGEFCAVELDDGSVGLALTLLDGTLAARRWSLCAAMRRATAPRVP